MAYRPYPNANRALSQVARHDDEWAPGGMAPPPLPLPAGWGGPVLPETRKLSPETVASLAAMPDRLQQAAEVFRRGAVEAFGGFSRALCAMQPTASQIGFSADVYRMSTRPRVVGGGE
ncbi:hypothetical protein [Streptomyces antibioticus]|uniref:Uncharacterized protein n=1 Tax=Streptomyces antibioticus TaxID=1890 RepID=A0AAE6YDG5_STRAT|nr:hypothetical protein [Streptomyces antibioticus]OOQ47343.1 hypothetical protein AFM16_31890 [Streptomyces antibioticus]QIT47666.1 hypothetical protein HCX60_32445 [Streptomyces antibioticus]